MGEPGISVIRVENPNVYLMPQVQEAFRHAFNPDHAPEWKAALMWTFGHLAEQSAVALFLARQEGDDDFTGLSIAYHDPTNIWNPEPFVVYLYAVSPREFDAMMGPLSEWTESVSGSREFSFLNQTGRPDEVYLRRIRRYATGAPLGSVIRSRWIEEDS